MKQYRFEDYESKFIIPETWNSLDEFIDWYMNSGMPFMMPIGSEVYRTENASAIVMFRQGRYQVELYINDPLCEVSDHAHPDLDLVIMPIGRMEPGHWPIAWGRTTELLKAGDTHNGNFNSTKGTVFLTFEYWKEGVEMTSASVNWAGPTDGKKHDELILKFNKNKTTLETGI